MSVLIKAFRKLPLRNSTAQRDFADTLFCKLVQIVVDMDRRYLPLGRLRRIDKGYEEEDLWRLQM